MLATDLDTILNKYGLLCHSFAFNNLPTKIKIELGEENHVRYKNGYLSLIANAGPTFWTEFKRREVQWTGNNDTPENPVDLFSVEVVEELLALTGLTYNSELLYPGTKPSPLISLGELANWSTPSPLGLGLHYRYGPWFAYRALIKTAGPLQSGGNHSGNARKKHRRIDNNDHSEDTKRDNDQGPDAITSPCLSCVSTACVSACPAQAVSISARFDISRCSEHRAGTDSNCKEQCHARNACPVGVEYRYSKEQRAYHMTHSLQALIAWADKT